MATPGAPEAIENTRTVEYRLAVDFQLAERPGKLRPLVGSTGSYMDKSAQIEDRFDELDAKDKVTRNGDTQNTDIDVERRFIHKPRIQEVAPLIDRDDQLATRVTLQSPIAVQTAKAVRRAQDRRWLEGFYGSAYTGETGATAVPFKSTNILAVNAGEAAPAGMTKNKLILMRELMQIRLVDMEEEMPTVIVTAKQCSDLLKINEVASRDYNPLVTQALQNGKVAEFLGFRFVPAEIGNATARAYGSAAALTVDGSGYRRVPVFVNSGMHWGNWEEFFGRIDELPGKSYSTQVYGSTCGAGTRVDEDKCFQMLCLEV